MRWTWNGLKRHVETVSGASEDLLSSDMWSLIAWYQFIDDSEGRTAFILSTSYAPLKRLRVYCTPHLNDIPKHGRTTERMNGHSCFEFRGSQSDEIEESGLWGCDKVSLTEWSPPFPISLLTSFSRAKFTMKILPSKRRDSPSVVTSHPRRPEALCPVTWRRNATDRHVRAMKLTRIIQLVMTFRSPAVVMTITAWLSLLIWLACLQATSFVLFWRPYVIRAPSVAKKLLLMYVSYHCAEFCVARPVVQLSRETRIGTSFLRWLERWVVCVCVCVCVCGGGGGGLWVISATLLMLCIYFPSRWVPPEEQTSSSKFHFRYFQFHSHVKSHYRKNGVALSWVTADRKLLHFPSGDCTLGLIKKKKKSEVVATTN